MPGNFTIINKGNGKVLANKAWFAARFWQRLKGLLGRKNLAGGEALIITPGGSIHTFFMRFSIDLIFLDKENRALEIKAQVSPWRLVSAPWQTRLVIELPGGVVKQSETNIGDILRINSVQSS